MGRKGSKTHKWTDDELKLLLETVQEATPMLEHYQRQGYTQVDWWASVSGMLFQRGGPVVTGKACARQFELWMEKQGPEPFEPSPEEEDVDKWTQIAVMVDDYEQGLLESLDERLEHVERGLKYVARVVDAVARDLGVKESWE